MKFFITFALTFLSLTIFAQEYLKPLAGLPINKQNLQRNNPFGGCSAAQPYLNAQISDFIYPDCLMNNGSLTVSLNTNIEGGTFDYYLNDAFIESTTEITYTFEGLDAGMYFITIIGEDGIETNLYEGLSNGELEGFDDIVFGTGIAFCGDGKIIKDAALTTEEIIYEIYDDQDNKITEFGFAADSVFVPSGNYYAFHINRSTFCAYYLPLVVGQEIPAPFPFADDFSTTEIYPDATLWKDRHVYINRTMAKNPISLGVATFDGLDDTGNPHLDEATSVNTVESADSLTSARFCFEDKLPSDSIYLKFYYQAMGYGDFPNGPDSLFLDFLNESGNWVNQWKTAFTDETPIETFESVNIAITDTVYFFNGFQFRFRNTATINGFNDHWHLDFVTVESYPQGFDPILDDISFVYPAPSLLTRYTSMPWYQFEGFEANETATENKILVRNNRGVDNAIANFIEIIDICNDEIIEPYAQQGIANFTPFSTKITNIPPASILPNSVNGNVVIQANYTISDASEDKELSHRQVFSNYLAYDDGTAEKAFGLYGAGGRLAQKYYINKPDLLQGVMIYFTHIVEDASTKNFAIKAWSSINEENIPNQTDVLIAERDGFLPHYDNEINYYTVYAFAEPVEVQDSFYIGFEQKFEGELNIGFDLYEPQIVDGETYEFNFNNSDKLFFDVNANWEQSIFEGNVMIRPILGSEAVASTSTENFESINVEITPNPATNYVQIQGLTQTAKVSLFSVSGQKLLEKNYANSEKIEISTFASGVYLLTIETTNGLVSKKFVKN